MVAEGGLFVAGTYLYLTTTRPKDRIGTGTIGGLLGILSTISVMNYFSPPPPDVTAIAVVANASWLFVLWASWVDRHRVVFQNRL
jgi:hypothetical protein